MDVAASRSPLLSVRESARRTSSAGRGRRCEAVDGVSFDMYAGRDAGHRRRERLRQERHRAVDPADRRSAGPDRRGRDPVPAAGADGGGQRAVDLAKLEPNGQEMRVDPRRGDRADLPGADVVVQPGAHASATRSSRRSGCTSRSASARRAREAIEILRRVGCPAPEQRVDQLRPPAQRRPAPARDDRDGAVLQADAADRRRADDRARRHHPGPDPRADAPAAAGRRHGDHADHPRPGRGRRDGRPTWW